MILTRIDPARNMARYYQIDIEPDLFGGSVLVRRWGRIGQLGQERRDWFAEDKEASLERANWRKAKAIRGYIPCETPSELDS